MKQRSRLIAYLMFMTLLISGSLFFSAKASHSDCPVCKHSLVAEGMMNHLKLTLNK